jgi:Na+/H+-translocating membrane pyrophosphatase
MIESKENEGLDKAGLSGLVFERPRFTSSVVLVSMFFAFYPLVYIAGDSLIVTVMLIGIVLMSVGWAANLIRILFTRVDRNYRILRASLSIWSTVVFTILWAAVVLLEIVIRNVFS